MPTFLITDVGLAAAIDANNRGLNLHLTTLVVAGGRFTPDGTETALMGTELARVNFTSGRLSGSQLTLNAQFASGAWTGYELGVLDSNGVLFAVESDGSGGDALLTKQANVNLAYDWTLLLSRVPSGSVTISPSIAFTLQKATETVEGIAELATQVETNTGTDDERIVTPLKLATRIAAISIPTVPNATAAQRGIVELATLAEVDTGTDTERAVTPAGVARRTRNATTALRGIAELATNAETQAGQDSQRIVTPAGLSARTATEVRRGIVELATVVEAAAGMDTQRAVTPEGMRRHGDARYARKPGLLTSSGRIQTTSALNTTLRANLASLDTGDYPAAGIMEIHIQNNKHFNMTCQVVSKTAADTYVFYGTSEDPGDRLNQVAELLSEASGLSLKIQDVSQSDTLTDQPLHTPESATINHHDIRVIG